MTLTNKIAISPNAVARQVGDETVILHLRSGIYFGLDPIGARIWRLMAEEKSLDEICDVLLQEYEVSREQLRSDMTMLIKDLLGHELISTS
jgi:Coenzyme PQQ synthesis protein D (PqqD)